MRNRFFFIILTTLILSAIGINLVHIYFFKNQKLDLIDQQIAQSSKGLLDSKQFIASIEEAKDIDDKITLALGSLRIGRVFVVRNEDTTSLFESDNMSLLQTYLPTSPEWVAVETDNHYIRIQNSPIPNSDGQTLQVGLVLDRNFINWQILDRKVAYFIAGLILTIFVAAALLTLVLLAPVRLLNSHLSIATESLSNLKDVAPLPRPLTQHSAGFWSQSDEFSSLVDTVQKLIDRINQNYKLTRSWTLQMAHELKTPLAVIRAVTESHKKQGELTEKFSSDIFTEVDQMSGIINEFLEWAELENSTLPRELHSIKMRTALTRVTTRLERIVPGRLRIHFVKDFSVIANPAHLDQLITNLITNALKFSADDRSVEIWVEDREFRIRDYGPGIPSEVLERLGEPFNIGNHEESKATGTGLGLAWIVTVSKLYGWRHKVESDNNGTLIMIQFPHDQA